MKAWRRRGLPEFVSSTSDVARRTYLKKELGLVIRGTLADVDPLNVWSLLREPEVG